MKPEELKPFVQFMEEHQLLVLSVQKPDFKIYLVKKGAESLAPMQPAGPEGDPVSVSSPAVQPEPKTPDNAVAVTSPLVGTFYRAPTPGAPPFVEVGQEVKVDDTLGIVEAMKARNEVKSEINGKVLQIKAENGKPVEFGQVLFLLEKT